MLTADDLYEQVRQDGYFVFPQFFEQKLVENTKAELIELLDSYEEKHKACGEKIILEEGFNSKYISMMHTFLFPSLKSDGLAKMIEIALNDAEIVKFIKKVIGEHYRMRVDLVRRSSGIDDSVDDFQIPHQWHRDTPGEFTFGIFFDDMSEPESGGTAVIKGGTHFLDYMPHWDFMLGPTSFTTKEDYVSQTKPFMLPRKSRLSEFFTKRLTRKLKSDCTEIRGKPGDLYFFVNDVWHGRMANVQGKRFVTVRFGGFANGYKFKDDIPLPDQFENKATTFLKKIYSSEQPENQTGQTLLNEMDKRQREKGDIYHFEHEKKKISTKWLRLKYKLGLHKA
mgnify:CR=1 FL=1